MKTATRFALVLTLVLVCLCSTAMATMEAAETSGEKLERFFEALVTNQIPISVSTLTENMTVQEFEGETTTYYALADYLMVCTQTDAEFSYSMQLFILQADVPDGVNADAIYALFATACTDGALGDADAADLVQWLRDNTAQTGLYARTASRDIPGFTATLTNSLSDSEESFVLVQYSGER